MFHLFSEIQCVNEYELYLKTLIHEIGMQLKSSAHCTGIQCIRHSYFNLDNALLSKHWTIEHIIKNMDESSKIIDENEQLLHQENAVLI